MIRQGENEYVDRLMQRLYHLTNIMALNELDRLIRSIEEVGVLFDLSEDDIYRIEVINICKGIVNDFNALLTYWGIYDDHI